MVLAAGLFGCSATSMPHVGEQAPPFALKDQNGTLHTLDDYRGKWVVLYFYPKDETPGCTREACSFRDNISALQSRNAVILGVSADNAASHDSFASKFDLNFPLLADTARTAINTYGVSVERESDGRKILGTQRATFLIDPQGKIAKVWPKVTVEGHVEEVLAEIR